MSERPEELGLKVLYEGNAPVCDIVAVHGLGATPEWAWVSKDRSGPDPRINWLKDHRMLPHQVPDSRIMTFNYESKGLHPQAVKAKLSDCANSLLNALKNDREEAETRKHRPLVFIGHSFGGLVITQALTRAHGIEHKFKWVALRTSGILFLGTPHRGTPAADWATIIANTGKVFGFGYEDALFREVGAKTHDLELLDDFTRYATAQNLQVYCGWELKKTNYRIPHTDKKTNYRIPHTDKILVSEQSARIDGIEAFSLGTDHSGLNKYNGPDDPCYNAVYPRIKSLREKASEYYQPDEAFRDCMRNLFDGDPRDDLDNFRRANGKRLSGSCEWILESEQYKSWQSEDMPRLLWIMGAPGIGKTMISSFLVETMFRFKEDKPTMIFTYYFCVSQMEKHNNAIALLRALLHQILQQSPRLFKHFEQGLEYKGKQLFASFSALWKIFESISTDVKCGEICCLVDGWDECDRESRKDLLISLKELFNPEQGGPCHAKFIIVSRVDSSIDQQLHFSGSSPIQRLEITFENIQEDLDRFITERVDNLASMKKYTSDLKRDVKHQLMMRAEKTFLYISLLVKDLEDTATLSEAREKLETPPKDLDHIYESILQRIDDGNIERARWILSLMCVARQPLTVEELQWGLALAKKKSRNTGTIMSEVEEMRDAYRVLEPLIQFNPPASSVRSEEQGHNEGDSRTITFIHQTVKDYLLGNSLQQHERLFRLKLFKEKSHWKILRACWACLDMEEIAQCPYCTFTTDSQDSRYKLKFSRYASQHWGYHLLEANSFLSKTHGNTKELLAKFPPLPEAWAEKAERHRQIRVIKRMWEAYSVRPPHALTFRSYMKSKGKSPPIDIESFPLEPHSHEDANGTHGDRHQHSTSEHDLLTLESDDEDDTSEYPSC